MYLLKKMKIDQRYLNFAIDNDAPPCLIRLASGGTVLGEFQIQLSASKIDFWAFIDLKAYRGEILEIECSNTDALFAGSILQGPDMAKKEELYHERFRPQFHFSPKRGWMGASAYCQYKDGCWHLLFEHNPFGNKGFNRFKGHAVSRDLVHWNEIDPGIEPDYEAAEKEDSHYLELPAGNNSAGKKCVHFSKDGVYSIGHFSGDRFVSESPEEILGFGCFQSFINCSGSPDERCIRMGLGQDTSNSGMPFSRQLLVPVELRLKDTPDGTRLFAAPVRELENLRVWKRSWSNVELTDGGLFEEALDFKIAPGNWPDIRILPAEGTQQDIKSELFELIADMKLTKDAMAVLRLCGTEVRLDAAERIIECQGTTAPLFFDQDKEDVKLQLLLDKASLELFIGGGRAVLSVPVNDDNSRREIALLCHEGSVKLSSMEIFGLRSVWPAKEATGLIEAASKDNPVIYESKSYTIRSKSIEDAVYGEPPAYVPDGNTIISPVRAVEEFAWRSSHSGDMTRVIDRGNVWHPNYQTSKFPDIFTGHNTFDAACRLAADVFTRCASDEFARPGEQGLWSAGQFQGSGEGFGVWVRDTAHVAIRAGNLLDPEGARRTLLYTTMNGFDNGVDGIGMPIVGICDYYLATGDLTLARDTWQNLKSRIAWLEERFDQSRSLVAADQSTSNDAFPEPECGGFSLATEIYFMEAFRAMARMGRELGEEHGRLDKWASMGGLLLNNIRSQYWKESAGFFTSGPMGSVSHSKDFWESSGQEMAIWPRYGIASGEQRKRILEKLPEVAMNEFGVNVFPYREETNHFCNAAWVVWTAGMAAAAGREGRLDLLLQLIAQQVRNCVMNKTFYEVIDYPTGRAWRWPGQLWQAAGFLSYFYLGVMGMEYDEEGLYFTPAVPALLAGLRIENLHYRKATFTIEAHGWGTQCTVKLDGTVVGHIPANVEGRHRIELFMK